MAVIREELVLVDRFSAAFSKFLSQVNRAAGAGRTAAAGQKQFESAARAAGSALGQMAGAAGEAASAQGRLDSAAEQSAAASGKLGDAANKASQSQDKMNRSMRAGQSAATGLERCLLSLARAYVSLRTAQAFVGLSDTMTQTKARLDRMNDGLQTTARLQDMIYQAAQSSRGNYQETIDMVGKLGTLAGEAFNSNAELVAFAEQLNKQFALAGASTQGIQAAMLQLTQAMSSGVLRGEELNSVLEQAPTIAQAIAKYMGVTTGEMRELASQGKITAQVVKEALFAAADETNAAFEAIPLTFAQAWTMAGNAAVRSFQPALQRLNDLLNSELGQSTVNGLIAGFALLGSAAEGVINLLAAGAQWVADNWDFVSTVLQFAGGAVLAFTALSVACSLKRAAGWAAANAPILLFVALVGTVITAMYAMGMSSEEVFAKIGAGAGWLYTLGYNFVASGWNLIATFAEFFANVFDNPVAAIANLFLGLFNFIMDVVGNAAGAIDALLGSDLSGAVKGFQGKVNRFVTGVFGENQVKVERMTQISYVDTMAQWSGAGAGMGRALDNFNAGDVLGNFSGGSAGYSGMLAASGIPGTLESIGADTAAIKRSVSLSEEDMKLLADLAERRYINNISLTAQTPVITINGQNTGNFQEDLQWLENSLKKILLEQSASHTDLSYI